MKMKKYFYLLLVTALFMVGGVITDAFIETKPYEIELFTVMNVTATKSINCKGKILDGSSKEISADYSFYIDEMLVKEGDIVTSGQDLLTLNKELSASALVDSGTVPKEYASFAASSGDIPDSVKAPSDGTISYVSGKSNSIVGKGEKLVTIKTNEKKQLMVTVSENRFADIKTGQSVEITGKSFEPSVYVGTVDKISETARQEITSSGSETVIDIYVSIDDGDENIKGGFSAKARVLAKEEKDVLLVPFSAVNQDDTGKEFVYLYHDGWAHKRYVTVDGEYDTGYRITSGINENDVIVNGISKHFERSFRANIC